MKAFLRLPSTATVLVGETFQRRVALQWTPWFLLLAFCVLGAVGCRSGKPSIQSARTAWKRGDLEAAGKTLTAIAEGSKRGREEAKLDLAIVDLAAGNLDSAERRLRDLRDHFDSVPDISAAGDAASLAVDDNVRPFQLAGYEEVLLRSMMAMTSMAGDGIDAEAYSLQAQSKQLELDRENADIESDAFGKVALAPYLRGALREATHQDYDDAERAFRLVSNIRPDFAPAEDDIARAGSGNHSQAGNGVLYLFSFVGHGPQLVETVAPTTTASLQIASTIIRAVHKQNSGREDEVVLPNIASVKVPAVEIPNSATRAIGVNVGGQLLGATQTLTDIAQLAIEKSEAEMPQTIARAVARRVLKEASVTATSQSIGLTGDAAAALEFAAMSAWSASEQADIRCWGLLPHEIQTMRIELPAGPHRLDLVPLSASGAASAASVPCHVQIEDGRNCYVLILAPEQIISVVNTPPGR